MTPLPLGILALAGGAAFDSSYDLLSTHNVTGTSTSEVEFVNLNQYAADYKHLQIRVLARKDNGDGSMLMTFNGVSTGYASHTLFGGGSSVVSNGAGNRTSILQYLSSKSSEPANAFAASVWDILDPFSSQKNTTVRVLGGTSIPEIILGSGLWNNTAAVTSILLTSGTGNFATYSRFGIYGSK
jgi:hypothetical protein